MQFENLLARHYVLMRKVKNRKVKNEK